jgi:hypothetical protein
MVWDEFDAWTGPRIIIERAVDLVLVEQYHLQQKHIIVVHIVHIVEKKGGDIPIGGVILLPMIPGGDIYQM